MSLSPLQNRVAVGQEPYLVFVADGEGGRGDLFLTRPGGGVVYPLTYTRLDESRPALAPDGGAIAFLRSGAEGGDTVERLVVLNLLNGVEREIDVGRPGERLGRPSWSVDGRWLRLGGSRWPAPPATGPAEPLPGGQPAADSAAGVWLGDPPFARAVPCPIGLCVEGGAGGTTPLAPEARDAVRWGADSVGYLLGDAFEVRPLGAGHTRQLMLASPPPHPRQPTFFPGP